MTKFREICSAHVALSDLKAEHARHTAAVASIFSRDGSGENIPAHWRATLSELPAFLKHCKERGIIQDLPAVSDAETLLDLLKKELLAGVPETDAMPAGKIRNRLLDSNALSAEEKARVPRLGRVKELLTLLAAREWPDYVSAGKGTFWLKTPEARLLSAARYGDPDFMHYLLRVVFLSDPPNGQGCAGRFTAEEIRTRLMDSPNLSAALKAVIPAAESIHATLQDLSHVRQKRGVITYKDGTAAIYWPDAYQKFLRENKL